MNIAIDTASNVPPYEQLRAQVASMIAGGALPAGTRLATVRQMAADLGLAPNTVARAYRELEGLGVIETRGRAGSVVTGSGVDQAARRAAHDFALRMRELGVPTPEALRLVRGFLGED